MTSNKDDYKIDEVTGTKIKPHEWDGIQELDNPMPRWWLIVFYITIIWSVWYWIIYPAWPTLDGNTKGTSGWTSAKQLKEQQAEIMARKEVFLDKFQKLPKQAIINNSELYKFAISGAKALFSDNCATCHGTGGAGAKGYPNLNDDDWLWGGTLDDIEQTITYGIRSGHDEARDSMMPAFGKDGTLSTAQISDVADHVLSLSGKAAGNANGAVLFAENCTSCHGENGQGDKSVGAPKLSDAIWLYGGEREDVIYTITNARKGVMPFWSERLSADQIKQLTIYVHSLGGGK